MRCRGGQGAERERETEKGHEKRGKKEIEEEKEEN